MGTLKEKFEYVEETKQKIREALEEMGATVTDEDTFRSYAEKIAEVHPDGLYIEKRIEHIITGVDERPREDTVLGQYAFDYDDMICPKIIYSEDYVGNITIPFSARGAGGTYSQTVSGLYISYHRVIAPETCGLRVFLNMIKPAFLILPTSANLVKYTFYNGSKGTDNNSFTTGLGFGQSVYDSDSMWINRPLSTTKRVVKFPKGFRLNDGKKLYLSKIYITQECMKEMVENLYDYIGTGEATSATRTISVGSTNKALLTADEIQNALDKGWKIIV